VRVCEREDTTEMKRDRKSKREREKKRANAHAGVEQWINLST